ncbi:MAG: hypothetical protein IJM19_00625 [Ruminococcus sp.]|nr:hypothetical protein [Ruminococcus sp.]
MKYSKSIAFLSSLAVSALSVPYSAAAADTAPKLLDVSEFIIRDENIVHLGGADWLRGAEYLFDEQDKVPQDPEKISVDSETLKNTSKLNWNPNQQMEYGSADFYIDFGANYVVTDIAFLDTNGTPVWTVSQGEPFNWNDIATVNMDRYNSWRSIKIENPKPTRYMHFSSDYCDSGVSEIALYGYKSSDLSKEQKAKTAPKPSSEATDLTAGQSAGFNAFIDDPLTSIMAAGNVREYHNLSWLIDSSGKVKFTQGSWGDMDSYYSMMKDRNISIIPCFQGGSTVISGGEKANEIPVPKDADTLDPKSYAIHAQAMYQVAARYGNNKNIDEKTINITDAQEVKTGMNLLNALENSNEPNKSWAGKANYFTPYELAAMCSADYDGHEGAIKNAGVKTADPDFKLAVGGLLTPEKTLFQYLDEMKLWFDYNRKDGKFAVDIINIHLSPDDFNVENSNFRKRISEIQDWIDKNAPGTELWISEFEIPMSDCEEENVDNHDNENYQLKYAQRVARTYLTAMAENVTRVTKFQLRDEGEGVYYNSGLVTQKGSWKKKKAWYYLSCMTSVLKNADFVSENNSDGVNIWEFKDRITGDTIKAVWSPTNEDKIIKNYKLSCGDKSNAYLTCPSEFADGTTEKLNIKDGKISLDVSETPVYITFSDSEKNIVNDKNSMIRPQEISLTIDKSGEVNKLDSAPKDSSLNQIYRMFDEPDTMPNPVYGDTDSLKTPETNVNKSGITAYAFFDKEYVFNAFAVFDTYGTGGISVYDAHTDKLLWSNNLGSYMTRSISMTADNPPTDCLKIVKDGGDLNEIALYGYESSDSQIKDWDINKDGAVDVFDMILMRQKLGEDFDKNDISALNDFILNKK